MRVTTPRLEPPPSPMVAADKEKKEKLLKIMDALDLAVNRAESNLDALQMKKEEMEKELNVKAVEDTDATMKVMDQSNQESGEQTAEEQQAALSMEIAKKIKAHRKKILKKVMPIGDIVETVKEANRMRAFAARVGLMKISHLNLMLCLRLKTSLRRQTNWFQTLTPIRAKDFLCHTVEGIN